MQHRRILAKSFRRLSLFAVAPSSRIGLRPCDRQILAQLSISRPLPTNLASSSEEHVRSTRDVHCHSFCQEIHGRDTEDLPGCKSDRLIPPLSIPVGVVESSSAETPGTTARHGARHVVRADGLRFRSFHQSSKRQIKEGAVGRHDPFGLIKQRRSVPSNS